MTVGIVSEISPGERRVAMVPGAIAVLNKTGAEFLMEAGAGLRAGFPDAEYADKGVRIAEAARRCSPSADVVLQVRVAGRQPGYRRRRPGAAAAAARP